MLHCYIIFNLLSVVFSYMIESQLVSQSVILGKWGRGRVWFVRYFFCLRIINFYFVTNELPSSFINIKRSTLCTLGRTNDNWVS